MKALKTLLDKFERELTQARMSDIGSLWCRGKFTIGNYIVSFHVGEKDKTVEIWNPVRDTYLDNISQWLERNCPDLDDVDVERSSIWDLNGFRDEADYLNYKFG